MFQNLFQKIGISLFLFVAPLVTFAQNKKCGPDGGECFGEVDKLFTNLGGFIDNILIPLVFTLTLLIFVFGMFRFFVWGQANEEDRSKGRQMILWSVIGMIFMVSIWGIVAIFSEGFFGNTTTPPQLPGTPTL